MISLLTEGLCNWLTSLVIKHLSPALEVFLFYMYLFITSTYIKKISQDKAQNQKPNKYLRPNHKNLCIYD